MVYPRYSMMFGDLEKLRNKLENSYLENQSEIEKEAQRLYQQDSRKAIDFLTNYSDTVAQSMVKQWKKLGEFLVVKYNDQAVKPEKNGRFLRTKEGLGETVVRPGFSEEYKKVIVNETRDKYLVPSK